MNESVNDLRAALRSSCGCCGITVTGFDAEFIRRGLCATCRGFDDRLGVTDVLDKVHLRKSCPARVRAREAAR